MEALFKNIAIKKINAVTIFCNEGNYLIQSCQMERNRGKVKVLSYAEAELNSNLDLNSLLPKDIPLTIQYSGENVLYKSSDESLDSVFPNIDPENFIIQSINYPEENLYGIMRIDKFHELLNKINIDKKRILHFYLFPVSLDNTVMLTANNSDSTFHFQNFKLEKGAGGEFKKLYNISAFNKQNEIIEVGEEKIEKRYFLAFSLGLNFLIGNLDEANISGLDFSYSRIYWGAAQYEKYLIKIALPLILLLALVLAFFYSTYYTKNLELSNNAAVFKKYFSTYEALDLEHKEKQTMISEIGWTRNEKLTKVVNLITESLIEGLALTQLKLNPYNAEKYRKESVFEFNQKVVLLEGKCSSASKFSDWVNKLSGLAWIEDVRNQKYRYDDFQKEGMFSIEVEIKLE